MKVVLKLLIVTAILAIAMPARADVESGIAAYEAERYREAFRELLPLAEAGDVEAQYYVGRMFYFGQGRRADTDKGVEYFDSAASQGHALAQIAAGDHFYAISKELDGNKYRARTLHLYLRAAKQGYPQAYLRLSTLFCEGISAPWLPVQADAWHALYAEVDGPSTWELMIKEHRYTPRCLKVEIYFDLAGTLTAMMADNLREIHDLPSPAESRARFGD